MSYPPERHMLRDLRLSSEWLDDRTCVARAPVAEFVRDAGGGLRLGAIATAIDVAGASLGMAAVHPDRTATIELAYQAMRAVREGPLIVVARPLRQGSRQLAVGIEAFDGRGRDDPAGAEPAGLGSVVFHRLPSRADHAPLAAPERRRAEPSSLGIPGSGLDRPYVERAGIRVLDAEAGALEIDNHDWVRNSFGSLNGGMAATLIEFAAERAASAATGQPLAAADLGVLYLAQSGPGPIRTRTRVLRHGDGHAVCRVSVADAGNGDKLLSLGSVTCSRLD